MLIMCVFLSPDTAFDGSWSVMPIVASLFGGMRTLIGPMVGALVITVVDEFVAKATCSKQVTSCSLGCYWLQLSYGPRPVCWATKFVCQSKVKKDEICSYSSASAPRVSDLSIEASGSPFPNKVAVIEPEAGGREWTYATLEDQSSALAASLAELGIKPGDRVALWIKNSVEYILSFYGILKAGGIVVPASTHYFEREVIHQLQVTDAAGIITTEERLATGAAD